jgi:hypothetical protein
MRSSLNGSSDYPQRQGSYTRLGRVGRRTIFENRLYYSAPCLSRVKCVIRTHVAGGMLAGVLGCYNATGSAMGQEDARKGEWVCVKLFPTSGPARWRRTFRVRSNDAQVPSKVRPPPC